MGKNARKEFSKNTRIGYPKNVGKKLSLKVRKHVFYKHMNIVTKKMGGKNARKKFSRNTRISRAKNDGQKSCGKCENTFFINTRIS